MTDMQRRVPCVLMRGGTSRGPYFLASDLPADPQRRDAVLLNAAAALFVAGKAGSLTEGWELAAQLIDGGAAANKLKALAGR